MNPNQFEGYPLTRQLLDTFTEDYLEKLGKAAQERADEYSIMGYETATFTNWDYEPEGKGILDEIAAKQGRMDALTVLIRQELVARNRWMDERMHEERIAELRTDYTDYLASVDEKWQAAQPPYDPDDESVAY